MKNTPIPPQFYYREYYLTNNSGWREWSEGKRDAGRFGVLFRHANIQKGQKVLDLGCGRGEIGYLCAKAGAQVSLLDYSPDAIELAKETMKEYPDTRFYCSDMKELPIEPYDHIFCLDTFEHLWNWELEIVLNRLKQCGGTFWLYTSPEKSWALKHVPDTLGDGEGRHINLHTKQSLSQLLKDWTYEFLPYKEMDLLVKATYEKAV